MTKRKRHQRLDLIADNRYIKEKLNIRIKELGLTYKNIVEESIKYNIPGITKSSLSVYLKSKESLHGSLTQKAVIYLCLRYGINIRIIISANEYDENKCLKELERKL